jgi:hypothetical protein
MWNEIQKRFCKINWDERGISPCLFEGSKLPQKFSCGIIYGTVEQIQ